MSRPEAESVHRDLTVDQVMRAWPGTIRVFLSNRMMCVGCPVGRLHTIEEACSEHGVGLARFLAELNSAVGAVNDDGRSG
jgi:hybrid cluster-associated redox disulfide protein